MSAPAIYMWVHALTRIGLLFFNADASGVSGSVGISSFSDFGVQRKDTTDSLDRFILLTRTCNATTISQKHFCPLHLQQSFKSSLILQFLAKTQEALGKRESTKQGINPAVEEDNDKSTNPEQPRIAKSNNQTSTPTK